MSVVVNNRPGNISEKKVLKLTISLLVLGGIITSLYLLLIKPEMQPCGRVDAYLGYSGCIRRLEFANDVAKDILFTPDGTILVTLSVHNTVHIWRVSDGELLHTISTKSSGTINNIALTQNGTLLAIIFYHRIELWRISDGIRLTVLQGDATFAETALTPDLSMLATGSSIGTIEIWQNSNQTLTRLHKLEGHTDQVWELTFTLDGTILASGSYDKTVKLWQVNNGTLLHSLEGQMGVIQSLAFTPDGTAIAAGGDRLIQLWGVQDGVPYYSLEGHTGNWVNPNYVLALAFSPDGSIFASGGNDNTTKIWRTDGGTLLHIIKHRNEVWSLAFSPDGTILASGEKNGPVRLFDVKQWDLE